MANTSHSLLTLPTEIRTAIWLHLFELQCLHVLQASKVWRDAEPNTFTSIQHLDRSHQHLSRPDLKCANCSRHQPVCLAAVCRQLFHEVAQLRYERTLLAFASAELALSYLSTKTSTSPVTHFSLSRLCHVQLHLGPAKYNTCDKNSHNQTILNALAKDANRLKTLNLTFDYFYRAPQETLLLSKKILACLGKFANLSNLNLSLDDALPGPIGFADLNSKDLVCSRFRWQYMEALIRRRVCPSSAWMEDCLTGLSVPVKTSIQPFLCARRLSIDVLRDLVLRLEAHRSLGTQI